MKTTGIRRLGAGLIALLMVLDPSFSLPACAVEEHGWAADIPGMLAAGPYTEGEVIVAVDPAYADDFDLADLIGLREDLDGEDLMTVPEEATSEGEAVLTFISRPGRTTEELLYALTTDHRVVYAEPNYIQEVTEPADEEASDSDVPGVNVPDDSAPDGNASGNDMRIASLQETESPDPWTDILPYARTPDLTSFQWGQKAIHTPSFGATGSNMERDPIVVAVIDEPVDFSHPDLAPVAFTFTEEQREKLGCDEHGYNAVWQSDDVKMEPFFSDISHGTHCAGIIGAAWDGHGISGVASNVRIISVQNCTADEKTSLVNNLRAYDFIRRANELGADIRIVNNSWGLNQGSLALNAAVRAVGEEWGTVSVFAAGNDKRDLRDIELTVSTLAADPYVIIVAASTPEGEKAIFSNYGATMVDMAAPGLSILSTVQPESSSFYPQLDTDPDRFLESFEDDGPRVTVVLKDKENRSVITDDRSLMGRRSLALELEHEDGEEYTFYDLDVTFHGLRREELGKYLGLSFYTDGLTFLEEAEWPGYDDGFKPIPKEPFCDYDAWATAWMEVPPEVALATSLEDLTVRLSFIAYNDVETVFFDAIGMGDEKMPYEFLHGTSQAGPMVAGAAAVLAAQTGRTGTELAELVRSKVSQTDGLTDKVITGGIFDFDADGTAPAEPDLEPVYPLYDTHLPLDAGTGDPFFMDAGGDRETRGPLVGLNDRLYYLPSVTQVEVEPGYKPFLAFDTKEKTWETLPELPLWLDNVSAAAFDGKLAVKGIAMSVDPDTGVPSRNYWGEVCVFIYDPAGRAWSRASSEGVLTFQTIFASESGLALLGSDRVDPDTLEPHPAVLADYDPENGATPKQTLNAAFENPKAVTKGDTVFFFNFIDYSLFRITAEGEELLADALPAYRAAKPDDFSRKEVTGRMGVLLPCDQGLLLVGVLSEDGATDTWLLRDGADRFEPLLRKTCRTRPFSVAAEILNGKVYAIGMVWNEAEPRFFRANDLSALNEPIPEPAAISSDETATRAMVVTMLWRYVGNPASDTKASFTDVKENAWYADAVNWAASTGAVNGTGEATFSPDTPVTREQLATILYRYAQARGKGFEGTWAFPLIFSDVADVSGYAYEPLCWMTMNGIITGMGDGSLAPGDNATRAQIATMFMRFAEVMSE